MRVLTNFLIAGCRSRFESQAWKRSPSPQNKKQKKVFVTADCFSLGLRQKLPDDFQTAEYLQDHGFVDLIVPRTNLRSTLSSLLDLHRQGEAVQA